MSGYTLWHSKPDHQIVRKLNGRLQNFRIDHDVIIIGRNGIVKSGGGFVGIVHLDIFVVVEALRRISLVTLVAIQWVGYPGVFRRDGVGGIELSPNVLILFFDL